MLCSPVVEVYLPGFEDVEERRVRVGGSVAVVGAVGVAVAMDTRGGGLWGGGICRVVHSGVW